MSDREQINGYLTALNRYLSRLAAEDCNEVIKEIESHIYDLIDSKEARGETYDVEQILAGFGSPRSLADSYTSHILEGTLPPAGFSAVSKVKHTATRSVYWTTLTCGYGLAALLSILAIMKLISPDTVGAWTINGGNSFIVGIVSEPPPKGTETLGWWLSPLAFFLSVLLGKLTRSLQLILRPKSRI